MIDPSLLLITEWMMGENETETRPVGAFRGGDPPSLQAVGLHGYERGEIPHIQELPVPAGSTA